MDKEAGDGDILEMAKAHGHRRERPRNVALSLLLMALLSLAPIKAARADYILSCRTQAADDFQLFLRTNMWGTAEEIVSQDHGGFRAYVVTEFAPTHYRAREERPEAAGSASEIYLDRLLGELTLTRRLATAAMKPLLDHCDNRISEEECGQEEDAIAGGNSSACSPTVAECTRWKNGSTVLSERHYLCRKRERSL